MSTATRRADRRQLLEPYRERLNALSGHEASPGVPSRVNIGSHSFSIEPWERGVVLGLLKGGGPQVGWTGLLADGLASNPTKRTVD